jgi:multimeric flavodoxin WrbA
MVEHHMKAFLDRTFGHAPRPSLDDKYGFAFATGGGPLEPEAAQVLH